MAAWADAISRAKSEEDKLDTREQAGSCVSIHDGVWPSNISNLLQVPLWTNAKLVPYRKRILKNLVSSPGQIEQHSHVLSSSFCNHTFPLGTRPLTLRPHGLSGAPPPPPLPPGIGRGLSLGQLNITHPWPLIGSEMGLRPSHS